MKYKVMEIQEDVDFGCEERSEGSPVMAVVLLRGEDGSEMMTARRTRCFMTGELRKGIQLCLMRDMSW